MRHETEGADDEHWGKMQSGNNKHFYIALRNWHISGIINVCNGLVL